jgi:hypothetical protein
MHVSDIFCFASQIHEDGVPLPWEAVDAGAHASVYRNLVNKKDQGSWDIQFVGKGMETHV